MSLTNWSEGISAGIFFIFGILIISMILERKKKRGNLKTFIVFFAVAVIAAILYALMYGKIGDLVIQYEDIRGGEETWLGNIVLSAAEFVKFLLPGIVVITATLIIYKEQWEEKVFVAILTVLLEVIVLNVVCELAGLPFSPGITDTRHEYPPVWIRMLIQIFWLGISIIVFRLFVKKKFLKILDKIKGEMGKFLKLPIASYIIFIAVLAATNLLGINFRSVYSSNVFVASVVIVGLILMYVLMYIALFDAIVISAESAKVQADLEIASEIQSSALPSTFPAFPDRKEFDIYATMHPAKEVGGDFYDFFMIDDDRLAFVIADVSGKGVPAALFMMAGKTTIRNQTIVGVEPGKILANSNMQLLEGNEKGLFITAFFGILNLSTGVLEFSNAGHNAPYICHRDQTVEMLKVRPGFVLGGMEDIQYRTNNIKLKPGDKIVLYTDGVTEAVNKELELYGERRFEAELKRVADKSIQEIESSIKKAIDSFADGAMQSDDVTMLIVEYKGAAI